MWKKQVFNKDFNDQLMKNHKVKSNSILELKKFIKTIDKSNEYHTIWIDKKGSKEKRKIYIPSEKVKKLQNFVVKEYLSHFYIDSSAQAYKSSTSILTNATNHIGNTHFLKIDIKDFFNNLKISHFKKILKKNDHFYFEDRVIEDIINITTYKSKFIQGSVSSPIISNIIFEPIDQEIKCLLWEIKNAKYTRYSDDIVISSSEFISTKILEDIKKILIKNCFRINTKKTYFTSNPSGVKITGLNIIDYEKISVPTQFKKELKQQIYKYKNDISETSYDVIFGKMMFLKQMDKNYYKTIVEKYFSNEEGFKNFSINQFD
ncbi:MAG: reverse transcriptase domain-containing protein [Mycoplasma sp.]